jgi:hypothetical protein
MPQIAVNTSNITNFGFSLNIDVYNRLFTFNLLPFTTGPNLSATKVSFFIQDQDGVELASVDFVTSGKWVNPGTTTTWTLNLAGVVNFPFLFQTYQVYASIQDAGGQIYSTVPIFPTLCQPTGLTDQGYVPGCFQITPDCVNNVLTVQEITALVYNSLQPTSVTKSGNLYYPTGTIAAVAFANTPFSNNVVYTGQYSIQCTTVATYAIGNDVYVLVSYVTNNVFPVTCANKMANILCCITKIQQTAVRECNNAIGANAKQQMADISMFVMNGLLKEISGQDSQFEVDYIKKYLSCDCGSASLSQSEFTPINPAVTSIVLHGVGGTTIPSPTITGNTETYNIASNVYQVVKGNTGDLAFTIAINTAISNTVQYIITFNYDTMAGYILTAIQNDPTLLAQLNALITSSASIIGLNGLCVINTSQTSYSLSQAVTGSTIITNIVINGVNYAAPTNLFANNPTAVAAWLNGLTLGTFTAAVNSGILTILSPNNTNSVSTLTFTSPNVVVLFQATNVTLVQVLQAIINFLCNLTALQVALGNALTLCTLDYNNNIVSTTYQANTTQQAYNQALTNAICNICARINSLVAFTCAKLQSLFSDNPNAQFSYANDRFLTIVGGACTTLTAKQTALAVIAAINADANTKAEFCAIDCAVPGTCPDITGLNLASLGQTAIGFYGVTWNSTPSANQSVTVRYRISGTSMWLTSSGNINLFPNGNINGTTPYQIGGLTAGTTYDVWVTNNCGGNGFVAQVTTNATPVYSGQFLLDNIIYHICGDSSTTLYSSSPFGTGVTMYTNPGLTTPVVGYTYIANSAGNIYQINSSTGVVGANTGSVCSSGTPGTYIIGNSIPGVCSNIPATYYTNGAFATGLILYNDSALTSPVTGNIYVVNTTTNHIFNLNSSTGLIGSDTGTLCSGTATLTFSFINAGGGSFLSFAASLSRAIDANVNINLIASNGYASPGCGGGSVASAVNNTTWTILAGSTGNSISPSSTSGSWASASHYSVFDVTVNGVPHSNGDVVTIGSFSVTIVIPSCV